MSLLSALADAATAALSYFTGAFATGSPRPRVNREEIPIWLSAMAVRRKRKLAFKLHALPYYFSTWLDDWDVLDKLLVEPGDALFITSYRFDGDRSTQHRKWHLIYLQEGGLISKIEAHYKYPKPLSNERTQKDRELVVKHPIDGTRLRMEDIISSLHLRLIERPFLVASWQIMPRTSRALPMPLDINPTHFCLGTFVPRTLEIDKQHSLPVLTVDVSENVDGLAEEARRMLAFGTRRIWRLWAMSPPVDGQPLTLVFEDIVFGSLVEALSRGNQDTKLRRHAVQIAEALRYLEKFQIVHGRLCLECCLLTYDSNVKLAVFGMSERSLLVEPKPNIDGDVETYRWLPPDCIPSDDVSDVSDYDLGSMVYTFGLMLWSLFHAGVLPYENEKARSIRSRRRAPPAFEDGFMPPDFAQVCLECWNSSTEQRPTFKRLKQWIRDLQRESRL